MGEVLLREAHSPLVGGFIRKRIFLLDILINKRGQNNARSHRIEDGLMNHFRLIGILLRDEERILVIASTGDIVVPITMKVSDEENFRQGAPGWHRLDFLGGFLSPAGFLLFAIFDLLLFWEGALCGLLGCDLFELIFSVPCSRRRRLLS